MPHTVLKLPHIGNINSPSVTYSTKVPELPQLPQLSHPSNLAPLIAPLIALLHHCTIAPLHHCTIAMFQWCNGTMMQWCNSVNSNYIENSNCIEKHILNIKINIYINRKIYQSP